MSILLQRREGKVRAHLPLSSSDEDGLRTRTSTYRRSGVVSTIVDVGSLGSFGSQRMYSRTEISHIGWRSCVNVPGLMKGERELQWETLKLGAGNSANRHVHTQP